MTKLLSTHNAESNNIEGILLVNKPIGKTSFSLVASLRRHLGIKKIGHAGTLDPLASGVMVMLVGKNFTRLSDKFIASDKEYRAEISLGISTDTYDSEGKVTSESPLIPTEIEIKECLKKFQGEVLQVPPMFSAKKKNGKKLYELARKGVEVERSAVTVQLETSFISYCYPKLTLHIKCSKGTYVRSIAHDIGLTLGCGAHLTALQRTRSGCFNLDQCVDGTFLDSPACNAAHLSKSLIVP